MSKLKEVNRMYIDRIIKSLTEDKEKWTREVMCGMEGCIVDYYSPKYKNTNGDDVIFSDKGFAGAHIGGMLSWTIGFWDYHNPFSDRSSKLRKAMQEMVKYHIIKDEEKRLSKLKKSIE
jgi:hypothetical protein